jgi:hypothetical protein
VLAVNRRLDGSANRAAVEMSAKVISARRMPWLFSPALDLTVFLGSAAVSLAFLAFGASAGVIDGETPDWGWIPGVLLVDVAHVWATGYRVYFDFEEVRRRAWLYLSVPVLAFVGGCALYSRSELLFWSLLAYLAVFHFVRQQYGWVALYRARAGEHGAMGRAIDSTAIYLATLYPLLYWHGHLPRDFWWFLENDFRPLPSDFADTVAPFWACALTLYAVRSLWRGLRAGAWNPGKDVVVGTTALCWYLGIVVYDSDYAFTVTNVFIHGIPYFAIVWAYGRRRRSRDDVTRPLYNRWMSSPILFLGLLWVLAYTEELLWDRGVWHERAWLFGSGFELGEWKTLIVPLLALPQITHYILDGFIWRRRSHPEFRVVPEEGAKSA